MHQCSHGLAPSINFSVRHMNLEAHRTFPTSENVRYALVVPRTRFELARPVTGTSPSSWRVYQFHHLGIDKTLSNSRAQNRNRTCTTLLLLVPETSASTSSATWANLGFENCEHKGRVFPEIGKNMGMKNLSSVAIFRHKSFLARVYDFL